MNQGTLQYIKKNEEKNYTRIGILPIGHGELENDNYYNIFDTKILAGLSKGDTVEYETTKTDKGFVNITVLNKIQPSQESEFTPKTKKEWKPDHFPGVSKITAEVTCSLIAAGHVDYKNVGPALLVVGDAAWTVAMQHEPDEIVQGDITDLSETTDEKESEKESLDVDSMSASELVREIEVVGKDIGKSENLINASTKTDDLVSLRACLTMYLDEQKEQTDLKDDKERT